MNLYVVVLRNKYVRKESIEICSLLFNIITKIEINTKQIKIQINKNEKLININDKI